MSREPPYRCEICGVAIDDRENVVVMSLHKVRRRARAVRRKKTVLFPEEFPNGTHEIHLHEACLFSGATQLLLRVYEDSWPEEPRLSRTKSVRR